MARMVAPLMVIAMMVPVVVILVVIPSAHVTAEPALERPEQTTARGATEN